jgi:hypothetical protein
MNFYTASLILLVFTFAFIAMDEYIAKPIRRRRLEQKAKTDPQVRRALEIADEVARRPPDDD